MSGANLSFYVRIDHLAPNYQAQPAQHGTLSFWYPPDIMTGYTQRSSHLFRWRGGSVTHIAAHDIIHHPLGQVHSAATVFTHNPDTPHLLVVPFDARMSHVHQHSGGWLPLSFRHVPIGNTQRTYSAVLANGEYQHIAAPGSVNWMPQLLPGLYDYQTGSPRIQAGLIGSIPLLIALAAFSAPPAYMPEVLTSSLRLGQWRPHSHQFPAGHIAERGMVVTIFLDPRNNQGSTMGALNRLENGVYGPFYS